MPQATTMLCPHCSADVPSADFCSACGMALPSLTPTAPRVINRKSTASTSVGQKLQSAELLATAKQAARSLLSIGMINLIYAGITGYFLWNLYSGRWDRIPAHSLAVTLSMFIAGSLYIGMYYWARVMPLTAAVVGLAVYLAKWAADVMIREMLSHNPSGSGSMNSTQFVRIIMVVYLFRGVSAGIKHRKLERQQHEQEQKAMQPMQVLPVD